MVEKAIQLNEKAGVQFSLSFLIQILGTVVLAVWGYSQLDARISQLSNATSMNNDKIHSIENDIRDNQDKPISSDHVQNTTLFVHERELQEIKARLSQLETRLYDSKLSPKRCREKRMSFANDNPPRTALRRNALRLRCAASEATGLYAITPPGPSYAE